jgi:Ohr subfamily peroxiredoxin
VTLSIPGTPGNGTNPEQLFAVGWSACFLSALKLVAGKKRIALPSDVAIDAEVDLGLAKGVHNLAARLNISLPGVDQRVAQSLVEAASHACPYSLATSGNIAVTYNVTASGVRETQHA